MKKFIHTLIIITLLFSERSQAQTVANYVFGQSNVAYTPLASPTAVSGFTWNNFHVVVPFSNVASGFNFTFKGVSYDRIGLNANGFITFGNTPSSQGNYQPITSTELYDGAVVAFGRDLIHNSVPIYYGIEGVFPNRTFVIEWRNARRYSSGIIVDGDDMNFQIRLLETSNLIKIHYGLCTATSIYVNAGQVGLRGASNADFNNRSAGINFVDWNASNFGTLNNDAIVATNILMPVSGLMFTYGAALPCLGTPLPGNTLITVPSVSCSGTSAVLKIENPVTTANVTYQWQSSSDNINFTNIFNATFPNLTVIDVFPQTYYRCRLVCNSNIGHSNSAVIVSPNTIVYANLTPIFTESFENWQNGCSTNDVPANYWKSSPSTGNNSWRRHEDGFSANWSAFSSYSYSPNSTTGTYSARFHSGEALNATIGKLDLYFNASSYASLDLSFDYINLSGSDSIRVYLSTNGGSSFQKLGSGFGSNSGWTNIKKVLNTLSSSTCVLRLEGYADYGNSDIGIDNLVLGKSCLSTTGTSFASGNNTYTLSNLCEETSNGYTYYGNGTMNGFAVKWGSNSANTKSNAVVKIISAASPTIYSGAGSSTFIQKRIWDVTLNPSFPLTTPVDVRFYYSLADTAQIRNLATAFYTNVTQMKWFKSKVGTFDPANATYNSGIGSIDNSKVIELTPIYGADPNGSPYVQFNGITSFSGGTSAIASGVVSSPLPIRFVDFNVLATGLKNTIKWSAIEDGQSDYFLIEKSIDSRNWITLQKVKAENKGIYEVLESNPSCVSYYRIHGFDKDGSDNLSATKSVFRKCNKFNIASISPNPTVNSFEVVFESIENDNVLFSIVDITGKQMFETKCDAIEGLNKQNINVENLPIGTYILKATQGQNTNVIRFVKQ